MALLFPPATGIDKKKFKKCCLLFLFASFLIFGKSVSNKFAMDDEYVSLNNKQIQGGIKKIPEIFRTSYSIDKKASYEYRPLVKVTYAIEYQFFGENPHISHLINILIYVFCLCLLFYILLRLLPSYHYIFPLTVVLIFMVHPIHSEVIMSLKNRDSLMSFIGCMLCLHFYVRYIEGKGRWNIVIGMFFVVFGLMSKKDFLPFFAVIPFTVWFFKNAKWKQIGVILLSFIPGFLIFGLSAKSVLNEKVRNLLFWENPLFIHSTLWQRIPEGLYCLYFYIKMFLIPYPLIAYYGYNQIPVVTWSHPVVWMMIIFLVVFFYYLIKNISKKPIWIYGTVYFFVTISMFLNIVKPVVGIVGERFEFIPSLGLCILTAYGLLSYFKIPLFNKEYKLKSLNGSFSIALIAIMVVFGGITFARNEDWKDAYTLYKTDVVTGSESAHLHSLLASCAVKKVQENPGLKTSEKRNLIREAEEHYLEAIRILPDYTSAHNNLGMVYYTYLKNNNQALAHFKRALELDTAYVEASYNIASCYASLKQYDLSEKYYLKTIQLDPDFKNTYQSLSALYSSQNKTQKIIELNQNAINKGINFDGLYINIGNVYFMAGDTIKALPYLEKAIEINANNKNLNSFLADYYKKKGNTAKAYHYSELMLKRN